MGVVFLMELVPPEIVSFKKQQYATCFNQLCIPLLVFFLGGAPRTTRQTL